VYGVADLPKFYAELRNATHFEWTNALCAGIDRIADCLAQKPNAQLIVSYVNTFFGRYLRQESVIARLDGSGLAAYHRLVPLSTVLAPDFSAGAGAAPSAILSGFGDALAAGTSAAGAVLPQSIGNTRVMVTDSQGNTQPAALFFSSPGQINFLLPPGASLGTATVSVMLGAEMVATGKIQVNRVAPGLFSADASGRGVAAAEYLRVAGNGARTLGIVFNPATLAEVPIDLGDDSDQVYLMLYGTGIRGSSALPSATIGGQPVGVLAFAAHSVYAGLDQVNIGPIPRSLRGRGSVAIVVNVDGKSTNAVTVRIQ
jgi:uncharacterized protein (TIGR03437 family)